MPDSHVPDEQQERPQEGLRLRFSMQTLMKAVTIAVVAMAILFAMPQIISVPILTLVAISYPTILLAGAMYGRDKVRMFCLGAVVSVAFYSLLFQGSFSWVSRFIQAQGGFARSREVTLYMGIQVLLSFGFSVANGFLFIWARRWIERRQGPP